MLLAIIVNSEMQYRYLLAPRYRVFLFFDGGYFYQKDREQKAIEDYKFSYGFGLRIETWLVVVGIDYGRGEGRGLISGDDFKITRYDY